MADPRTYRGRSVEELIPRIQDELGAGAIILARREGLTGGIAGFFQRPFVELEATEGGPQIDVYDEPQGSEPALYLPNGPAPRRPGATSYPSETPPFAPARSLPLHRRSLPGHDAMSPSNTAYVSKSLAALARAGPLEPAPEPGLPSASTFAPLEVPPADPDDPFALMLERASERERNTRPRAPEPASRGMLERAQATARPPVGQVVRAGTPSRARAKIQEALLALGVSAEFAAELIDGAAVHIRPFAPRASLAQDVRAALTQRIPVAPLLPARGAAIVLVGPGGAGKTTCCAALLRAYRRASALPASCATLVRTAASGELRMLLSPYVMKPTAIDTPRALRALHRTKSEGLLVIDTPPLSPGDRTGIRALAALLGELEPERVVVVLPATLGAVAASQLLKALRPLRANALALTHSDDTDQMGVAIEAACKSALAPEYMLRRARGGGWTVARLDPAGLAAKLVP